MDLNWKKSFLLYFLIVVLFSYNSFSFLGGTDYHYFFIVNEETGKKLEPGPSNAVKTPFGIPVEYIEPGENFPQTPPFYGDKTRIGQRNIYSSANWLYSVEIKTDPHKYYTENEKGIIFMDGFKGIEQHFTKVDEQRNSGITNLACRFGGFYKTDGFYYTTDINLLKSLENLDSLPSSSSFFTPNPLKIYVEEITSANSNYESYLGFDELGDNLGLVGDVFDSVFGKDVETVYYSPIVYPVGNLFYCKTTQDLIENIKIPSSWQNNKLDLYCNDGSKIGVDEKNFEFVTENGFETKVNSYKTCVLKNVDLDQTILFGFDVGNKLLDSSENFFNYSSKTGSIITTNLEYQDEDIGSLIESIVDEEIIEIPYGKTCSTTPSGQGEDPIETCNYNPVPENNPIIMELIHENESGKIFSELNGDIVLGEYIDCSKHDGTYNLDSITDGCKDNGERYYEPTNNDAGDTIYRGYKFKTSIQKYKIIKSNFSEKTFKFKDKINEEIVYFDYDNISKMFVLRDFNDILDLSFKDILPSNKPDIDLSRIAIFRKLEGDNWVYGYETPLSVEDPTISEILPIYKIANSGINSAQCENMLAKYGATSSGVVQSEGVTCRDEVITINSFEMELKDQYDESLYGQDFEVPGTANSYKLFKNIMYSLK